MAVRLLLQQAGYQVVGEAGAGLDVVAIAQTLQPDLIILDIDMPGMDGFAVLKRLCIAKMQSKVVVFSGLDAGRYSFRCSTAGALAFISKDGELRELLGAIQSVLNGDSLFPITGFTTVDSQYGVVSEGGMLQTLSNREVVVLRHLVRGRRIKDIAEGLMISDKTISTYKSRLIQKLKAENFLELVDMAKRNGIV